MGVPANEQPPTLDYATPAPKRSGWLRYRALPPGKLVGALTGFGGLYLSIATLASFDGKFFPFAIVAFLCFAGAAPVMLLALFLPGWRPSGWWREFRGALGWVLLTLIAVSSVHACPHSVWLTVGPGAVTNLL